MGFIYQQVITVFEHQVIKQNTLSNPIDFQWLVEQVESSQLPCLNLSIHSGKVVLVARHYLSVIYLPSGYVLEILPKISKNQMDMPEQTRAWVSRMLKDIYGIRQRILPVLSSAQELDNHSSSAQIWLEPIIEQWFQLLIDLQLPRYYQKTHENTPQAQGKLLIKQQIKYNSHRPHFRYTSQHTLGLHELWGQFFQTVVMQITTSGISVPTQVQHVLMYLNQASLTDISHTSISVLPIEQWQNSYQRLKNMLDTSIQQSQYLKEKLLQMLELSWLILQWHKNTLAIPVAGKKRALAVMIDMNQAFELWVTNKLKADYQDALKSQVKSVWLISDNKTEVETANRPRMDMPQRFLQPDLLIINAEGDNRHRIKAVGDIKYKAIGDINDINTADLYQLFTYQQHWQAEEAWLIYPKTDDFYQPMTYHLESRWPLCIHIFPFDIMTGKIG